MDCKPPSRTTAPGRRPSRSAGPQAFPACGHAHRAAVLPTALASAAILAIAALGPGCDGQGVAPAVPASSHDKLTPGTSYSVCLDGDSAPETVLISGTPPALTITDGEIVYHSRERWEVVEAALGDTDHDGLLEVVTLLDDEDGRHIGLFGFFGGEYRERLVTSEIDPRPVTFEIVGSGQQADERDLLLITVEPAPGGTELQTVLCRWNGFGFTEVERPPER